MNKKQEDHLDKVEAKNKKEVSKLVETNDDHLTHPLKDDKATRVDLDTNHDNDVSDIEEISNPLNPISEEEEDEIEEEVNNRFKVSPKTIIMGILSLIGALAIIFVGWGFVEDHLANRALGGEADQLIHNILVDRAVDEKDGPIVNGDIVNINYVGTIDGVAFEGGTAENQMLEIGSNMFIPGFEENLIGHNVGDEFEFPVVFPEDYHVTEFAGVEAIFHITVNRILALPTLNDEFVQSLQIPNISTVRQLRDYAIEYLRAFYAQQGQ